MWLSSKIISSGVAARIFWEDFEVGNRLDTRFGGTDSWARVAGNGGTLLEYTGGQAHSQLWDDSEVFNASDNVSIEALVRADGATTTNLTGFTFGKQTGSNGDGYQVLIDRRSGSSPSNAGFALRENLSFQAVLASDTSITIARDVFYRIEVDWRTTGTRITCRLYNSANTLLSTITSNDASYTSGRVGAYSLNPGSIDDIDVTTNPPIGGPGEPIDPEPKPK